MFARIKTFHVLVGMITLGFTAMICGCSAITQADKRSSKHDGVIYRNPRVYNVEYSFEIFPDPNKVDRDKDLKLWVPIPREWDSQKAVKIVSVEPEPHAKYVDPEYGNPMLFWDFGKEPEKPSYKVHLKYRLEQYDVHSSIDPNRVGSYEKTSRYYALYTRSTNTVTITDKVRTLAKTAVGDEKNPYLQAKRIYDFVRDKMYYRKPVVEGTLLSVETILTHPVIAPKTGQEHYLGACYHQSMVFVALCRAVGIPARSVFAWHDNRPWIRATPENPEPTVQLREASVHGLTISHLAGFFAHAWAEIYLPNYGWVPVDPTYGRFGNSNLNNKTLIITKGRDVQIDPHTLPDGEGDYRVIMAPLHEGRADLLLWGVFHTSTVRKETLNHPDPFPADALAEYAAKLYPETEAAKNLGLYRRRTLRWIDEHTREHTDKAEGLAQAYRAESRARYDHEAFICHMLCKIVGDKKFFEIVETYTDLRVKSGEPVSTARFQEIAEDAHGQPLDWFFKQWVGYTELPQIQLDAVTFSEDERGWHVHGTLRQLNKSLFRLPVELVLETEKAPEHKTFWVENRDTAFEFQTAHKPKDVLVDPNNDILQIREMSPLLESSSYDEIAFCTITDQDKADWFDWTPLHFAAEAGQADVAEYLITSGADVNAENIRGETPLQFAADKGHKEVAELLIAKGAEVSSIHVAARIGASAQVATFLEEGTDINAKDALGQTALHHAARAGYKEIVELLLAHGADVNIGEDSYNRTAAEFAMNGGHDKIVELLISKGADIPPLHLALYAKDKSKARSLIEGGADVNKRTGYGTNPLHRAVSAGYTGIVELLIDKGADVNAKDNWSWTPLHSSVYQGKDIVELLIAKGANLNARDGNGRTPLWYAQDDGHTEIVELLRKHGARE
ncbi:ankyrin repeat domain-containing protein [Planctomycetota bacterium]